MQLQIMWYSRFASGSSGNRPPPASPPRSSAIRGYEGNSARVEHPSVDQSSSSCAILYGCVTKGTYVQAEYTAVKEGEEEVLSSVSR